MIRNLDNNDSRSVQQAMEVYGILSGKRGDLNIVMNQSNQNASVARSSKENGAFASFEEIARVVDGERRKLLSGPTEVIEAHFEPTPDD
jgi:hypothetical protein